MHLSLPACYSNLNNLLLGKLHNLILLHCFSCQNPEFFILFIDKNYFTEFQPHSHQQTDSGKERGKICVLLAKCWLETQAVSGSLHSNAYFECNTMHNCVIMYSGSTMVYLCQVAEAEISYYFAMFVLALCNISQSSS